MITRFQVKNFKALRDVTLELTPLHVLIGPNDSGKTSILEALSALCRSVDQPLKYMFVGRWKGAELVWQQNSDLPVSFSVDIDDSVAPRHYALGVRFQRTGRRPTTDFEDIGNQSEKHISDSTLVCGTHGSPQDQRYELTRQIHDALTGVQTYRWNPQLLALPVAQSIQPPFKMEPSGFGLARLLDDILGHDRDLFARLEGEFTRFFPEFCSIKLQRESSYEAHSDEWGHSTFREQPGKGLYLEQAKSKIDLPASQISDGVLLILAYLAVLHSPKPPRVLLIEEPENGIYPLRLKKVIERLKEIVTGSTHVQIVLTTHSPYILDLFKPEEVTLCRKNPDGAVETFTLSRSRPVQEQIDVFTLGEIWSAEGEDGLAQPIESGEAAPR